MNKKLLLLFFLTVLLFACNKQQEENEKRFPTVLKANVGSLAFAKENPEKQTIEIISDGEWWISSTNNSWCNVSVSRGSGNAKVEVSVSSNWSLVPRSAALVLITNPLLVPRDSTDTQLTYRVNIVQDGAGFFIQPTFSQSRPFLRGAQEIEVPVRASVEYKIVPNAPWITVVGSDHANAENDIVSTNHKLSLEVNETYETRVGVVEFQAVGDTTKAMITIIQRGYGDRDILEALYEDMNGRKWGQTKNWLSDQPLNKWAGVSADEDDNVWGLDFYNQGLVGGIPDVLGELKSLKFLNMSHNLELTGSIPARIGQLDKLEELHLFRTSINGPIPEEMANLKTLSILDINSTPLNCPVQWGIFTQLTGLRNLNISETGISGEISEQVGDMMFLEELYLSSNDLTGNLPASIGSMNQLRILRVDNNNLSGTIPQSIVNNRNYSVWKQTLFNQKDKGLVEL